MFALDEFPRISGPVVVRLTGANAASQACVLLGIAQGKMHIRGERWVEPASIVSAALAGITISGEVAYCTRKDTSYRTCIALFSENSEVRSAPRLPVHRPAKVVALSGDGSESALGMMLDLSVSGMRLEIQHCIETGTMVFIETESALLVGEVRHCRKGRQGYFEAGVEITDILSDTKFRQNSWGVLKKIRRKLAQAILGETIPITRKRN